MSVYTSPSVTLTGQQFQKLCKGDAVDDLTRGQKEPETNSNASITRPESPRSEDDQD